MSESDTSTAALAAPSAEAPAKSPESPSSSGRELCRAIDRAAAAESLWRSSAKGSKSPLPLDKSYSPCGVTPEARTVESRETSVGPPKAVVVKKPADSPRTETVAARRAEGKVCRIVDDYRRPQWL